MQTIQMQNIRIGDGIPKICVPIMGQKKAELLKQAQLLELKYVDLVEWRVDYFQNFQNISEVIAVSKELRKYLPTTPILFTFRTRQEGGEQTISVDDYFQLNTAVAAAGYVDCIDLELFITEDTQKLKDIIHEIQNHHRKVILSNHDFRQTPKRNEICFRLNKMQTLGCDISKIAVMPNSPQDVLELLEATNEMKNSHADRPFVTMSMGNLGCISRICGELFGSAITFANAGQASAPGQLPLEDLYHILSLLHI